MSMCSDVAHKIAGQGSFYLRTWYDPAKDVRSHERRVRYNRALFLCFGRGLYVNGTMFQVRCACGRVREAMQAPPLSHRNPKSDGSFRLMLINSYRPVLQSGERLIEMVSGEMWIVREGY